MNKIIKWLFLTVIFGVVLYVGWGHYLLLTLPGTTIKDGEIIINNCAPPRDENAKLACPMLYCNKNI